MNFIRFLPLTLVVVIIYNLTVFGGLAMGGAELKDALTGAPNMERLIATQLFEITMVSGKWSFTYGSLFVTLGLFALFVELLRSTRTDTISIANHALSTMVLVLCLLEFVVVPGFNTSVFFYLTLMAMIDVVAGFTVTIISARRDFGGPGVAL
jgi:hypothetical protein